MLLENTFYISLVVFLIMICVATVISRYRLFEHRRYDRAIMITLMLSGLVTIITAIWWIVRAWG